MMTRRSHLFRGKVLLYLLLLANLILNAPTSAAVWHVRADAVPPGNGSPESPFTQIQTASFAAHAGDSIVVHGGTYYETVKPVHSGVASPDGQIRYIYYIAAGDGPAIIKAQANFCFLIGTSTDEGLADMRNYLWIEGFYLTRGLPTTFAHAAAIRTFSNYGVFLRNHVYDNDIGIFCEGNGHYDEHNNNRGNYIAHNVFSNCGEAGVRLKHSSQNDVVFNLFYNNGLGEPAGAVTFYCGIGNRIINNTFWNNRGWAVAVYNGTNSDSCMACSDSEVRDNIFARSDPGLLLQVQEKTAMDGSSSFSHNLFWTPDSASPVVEWGTNPLYPAGYFWNVYQYKWHAGQINPLDSTGVIFADPQFVNPWNYQFDLQTLSPAMDAGSRPADQAPYRSSAASAWQDPPDFVFASMLTPSQNQGLDEEAVDLGYHHLPQQYSINPPVMKRFTLNLYPNPVNGDGELAFILPNASHPRKIQGKIYDVQGRVVEQFNVDDAPLNVIRFRWNTSGLSSGNYFVVLNVDGKSMRQKILLMK
jgi:hypothetical protein